MLASAAMSPEEAPGRLNAACLLALQNAAGVQEAGLSDAARWALRRVEGRPL